MSGQEVRVTSQLRVATPQAKQTVCGSSGYISRTNSRLVICSRDMFQSAVRLRYSSSLVSFCSDPRVQTPSLLSATFGHIGPPIDPRRRLSPQSYLKTSTRLRRTCPWTCPWYPPRFLSRRLRSSSRSPRPTHHILCHLGCSRSSFVLVPSSPFSSAYQSFSWNCSSPSRLL